MNKCQYIRILLKTTEGVLCIWGVLTRAHGFTSTSPEQGCICSLKPLSHQSGVLTAFPQRLKNAERRGARCANASNAVETLWNAVESPRTPCGGVYFEHAQNKRRGMAFPQRVRQHAVATLWQRCGVF